MNDNIKKYHNSLSKERMDICTHLFDIITDNLNNTENKVWHGHPVWFIAGNSIVGYSSLKDGVRLMFWSGDSFEEANLKPGSGKFKDASITFLEKSDINTKEIIRWLKKSQKIQWDYKNIIKNKGKLYRLQD